jgi:drug/metabolite transporter (DMT)-like permease
MSRLGEVSGGTVNTSRALNSQTLRGATAALVAAALFGVSAPLGKLLLRDTEPLALSGILYLGAGLGLTALRLLARARSDGSARETPLRRADIGLLLGVTLAGGVLGPVLLLWGLQRLSAVSASLLLNLEAPLTIVLAVGLFGEHLGRREAEATGLILLGLVVLSDNGGTVRTDWLGVVAICGACLSWAVDNNLTQRLSLRDPLAVARAKGLLAGGTSLLVALGMGQRLPSVHVAGAGLLVGFGSYGLSLVLVVYAMRLLGAAREGAFFATAPFVGAAAAVPLVGESVGVRELGAAMLMGLGVALLLREQHDHVHAHDPMEHEHGHTHDEHHQHEHTALDPAGEPHAHEHRHSPLEHEHPHVPDIHHRHH